LKKVA